MNWNNSKFISHLQRIRKDILRKREVYCICLYVCVCAGCVIACVHVWCRTWKPFIPNMCFSMFLFFFNAAQESVFHLDELTFRFHTLSKPYLAVQMTCREAWTLGFLWRARRSPSLKVKLGIMIQVETTGICRTHFYGNACYWIKTEIWSIVHP